MLAELDAASHWDRLALVCAEGMQLGPCCSLGEDDLAIVSAACHDHVCMSVMRTYYLLLCDQATELTRDP